MRSAAVARSGCLTLSNLRRNFRPSASSMMKPGFAPFGFASVIVQGPDGSSGASVHEPRSTSSIDMGAREVRLVNQLESGTSSIALTFTASPAGSTWKKRDMGRKSIWSAPSQANGEKYSSGTGWNVRKSSESTHMGSSRGKRRMSLLHAAIIETHTSRASIRSEFTGTSEEYADRLDVGSVFEFVGAEADQELEEVVALIYGGQADSEAQPLIAE